MIAEPVESTQRLEATPVPPAAPVEPPPGPAPVSDEPDEPRGRGWLVALLVLALVALGLALAYALTDGFGGNTPRTPTTTTVTAPAQTRSETPSPTRSSPSPTKTTTTTTTTTSTTSAPPQSNAQLAKFVRDYYRDVTKADKRDDTFARLTPRMQEASGGRDGYEEFWSGIRKVDVGDVEANAEEGTVTADLTFKPEDGKDISETHRLTVVHDGESWLIDSDTRQ